MKETFHANIHPSRCELLTGMTVDDVFQRIGANQYEATLDPENPSHCDLFRRWLPVQTIDILKHKPENLIPFDQGFSSQQTVGILEQLRTVQAEQGKAYSDHQTGEQEIEAIEERRDVNSDPSQVSKFVQELIQKRNKSEKNRVLSETLGRRRAELWEDLLESLTAARQEQAREVRQLLEPIVQKVNNGIREAVRTWQREAAPLLVELHKIDPSCPGEIYYNVPPLTMSSNQGQTPEQCLLLLKRFQAHPIITAVNGRYEFDLEKVEVKK